MSIQFQCSCGKQLRAPDDKAGKSAKCPKCSTKVKIPSSTPALDAPKSVPQTCASQTSVPPNPKTQTPSTGTPNVVPVDNAKRCRKCGRVTDERGFCSTCKYASADRGGVDRDISAIKIRKAGFHLWVSDTISEGVPTVLVSSLMHVLMFVFIMFAIFVVFTTATGLLFFVGLAFFAALAFFYGAWTYKVHTFLKDPYAELAWFQRPVWDGVLWFCRKNDWKDGKSNARTVIDQRNTALTDALLDKLPGLKDAEVLDLEGTLVTDESFRYFHRMEKLQCLILKETNVSHESVFRLQQTKPRLWIWY